MKWDDDFFTNEFFTNMVYPNTILHGKQQKRCPGCGNTYDQFNQIGKFGCSQCYDTFQDEITSLVSRLQGHTTYEGRVPSQGHNRFKIEYEIKQLRHQLEIAVEKESFEEAVSLRDKIKQLESSIQSEV